MKRIAATITVVSLFLMAIGCNNLSVGPKESAPTLPAAKTMSIPTPGNEGSAKIATSQTKIAWTLSALTVLFWTAATEIHLLVPKALFVICHSTTPTELDDKTGWKWTVSKTINQITHSAVLIGKVQGDSVRWSMTVTNDKVTDFTWFTGTSTITGTSGYWTFYDTTASNPAVVLITYNVATTAADAKVEIVQSSHEEYGNYLSWAENGDQRTFEGYDADKNGTGQSEHIVITWDAVTEAGSVENKTTGVKNCWDTKTNGHEDIPCQG